jgi:hypothetical protein
MRPLACCRKPELPFVVQSESVARRSAVIDPIREISVDVTKRVIDKYCTIRQAHNLKVIGSNPIHATTFIIIHSPCRFNHRDERDRDDVAEFDSFDV